MPGRAPAREPSPISGTVCFEEGDFHALSEGLAGDVDANARRLVARRKLLALGKAVAKEAGLECRTSLHNPNTFNGMRVRRLWAYLTRSKAEKRALKSILGRDLGKDLDAAYRNAYLCLALEHDALEVSLRIHPEAWYDGQNLKNRVAREGPGKWLEELDRLEGFRLRMDDWKGEWRCGELTVERLEEFLSYYTPGDHRLAVERRFPAPPGNRGVALEPEAADGLRAECLRLLPLYRFTVWTPEQDFLFG
jgi:hypothetical protein